MTFRRIAMVAAVALAQWGCSPSGRHFELTQLDTVAVPISSGYGWTAVSGSFTLWSDGSCERLHSYRVEGGSALEVAQWSCTWEEADSGINITWDRTGALPEASPEGSTVATLENGVLTAVIFSGIQCVTTPCPSGFTEVYREVDATP